MIATLTRQLPSDLVLFMSRILDLLDLFESQKILNFIYVYFVSGRLVIPQW